MNGQGWDRAEFTCGRCGETIEAGTEAEYIRLIQQHRAECTSR